MGSQDDNKNNPINPQLPPNPPTMPQDIRIRPALYHELDAIASIAATCFADDAFNAHLYPSRQDHPDAFRQEYRNTLDASMNEPLTWIMVAEHESPPTPWAPIGYAIWTRQAPKPRGKSVLAHLRAAGLPDPVASMPLSAKVRHCLRTQPLVRKIRDRANVVIDRESLAQMEEDGWGRYEDPEQGEEPDHHWFLFQLAVVPEERGKGVGKAMLEWGVGWARREGVPVLLCSTPMEKSLYKSEGFVVWGVWRWGRGDGMVWESLRLETGGGDGLVALVGAGDGC